MAKKKTRGKVKASQEPAAKAKSLRREYTIARISGKKRAKSVIGAAGTATAAVKPKNKVVQIGPKTSAIVPIDADENEVRARYGKGPLPFHKHRAENTAAAASAPREPLPAPKRMQIKVDEIDDSAAGGRSAMSEAVKADIAELADSIKGSKMLQPIGVVELNGKATKDKKYGLVWGFRRTQAVRWLAAGAEGATIEAEVFPASCAGRVEELRAIENVQRADWDLIEEAMAVARMLEQTPADEAGVASLSARCRAVGARLGKSESWVLDRSYLSRLSGKARDLVKCGRLPLQQAREISTLADPALRDRMAEMAARQKDMSGGMSFDRVARWCRDHRHSLKTVPWRLDVEFAGKPACSNCPSNTANDITLFAHDDLANKEVEELGAKGAGLCMNEKCFESKRQAAEKTMTAAVTKVRQARKEDKTLEINATGLEAGRLIPGILKTSSFVRKAQNEVLPSKKSSSGTDDGKDLPGGGPKADKESPAARAKRNAQEAHARAEEDWRPGAEHKLFDALSKTPGAILVLTFYATYSVRFRDLQCQYGGRDTEAKCDKLCQSPDIRAMMRNVVEGKTDALRELEIKLADLLKAHKYSDKVIDTAGLGDSIGEWGLAVVEALGEIAKAGLDPRPRLETFLEAQGVPAAAKNK